jgi:aryl-alcohol dehydrogenase-like predicted oxidoreductase
MQTRELGQSDLPVSALCYGGAGFGCHRRGADLDALLNAYRDAGGNFIDTAHCYSFWTPAGAGCSECAIGDYVQRNGKGDLVVATKGGHPGVPGYRTVEHWLSPARVAADIDDSLGRLRLDTIDLLWLHRDDTRLGVQEILETLNAEVRRGRIRWFGASNWHSSRIAAANAWAASHGLQGFVANQPEWSLADKKDRAADVAGTGAEMRFLSDSDRAWHRVSQLPVVCYSATAGGYFADPARHAGGAYDTPLSRARARRAGELAARLGATPGQIALAWLLHQDVPVIPITGTLDAAHLQENLAAVNVSLSPSQLRELELGAGA